jgi:hypothetical protein
MCSARNDADDLLLATVVGHCGRSYRLAVEPLPAGGWEWIAWPAGAEWPDVRSGVAASSAAAMAAAERAAGELDDGLALLYA